MRRFLLILLSVFAIGTQLSYAQNTEMAVVAQRAFDSSNYKDAVEIYTGVVAAETNAAQKKSYEQRLQTAKNCLTYTYQANAAYNEKRYSDAINLYNRVIGYNSKDTSAKSRVQQCNRYIAQAEESNYWEQIVAQNSADGYKEYLNKYPNGLYVAQANNTLKEVDYWKQTLATNTKVAYVEYLSRTTVNWHKEEAQSKVDYFTDQELWAAAKKTNTKAAYSSYLSASKVKPAYGTYANAMIALFDARSQYDAKQYTIARSSFESYKKVYTLSSNDQPLYLKCCEESDYASFIASSTSNKRYKGKTFLTLYPKSTYVGRVKSEMSRSYASSWNFDEAKLYAQNDSDNDFIKSKQKFYKKASRGSSKSSSTSRSSTSKSPSSRTTKKTSSQSEYFSHRNNSFGAPIFGYDYFFTNDGGISVISVGGLCYRNLELDLLQVETYNQDKLIDFYPSGELYDSLVADEDAQRQLSYRADMRGVLPLSKHFALTGSIGQTFSKYTNYGIAAASIRYKFGNVVVLEPIVEYRGLWGNKNAYGTGVSYGASFSFIW